MRSARMPQRPARADLPPRRQRIVVRFHQRARRLGLPRPAPGANPLRGNLIDVAPVDVPAYPTGTSAALRSLARHVGAPIEAVLQRAERGELRGFFTRTDRPSQRRRPMTAAQAKMYMAGRRWPDEHRRDHNPPRRLTGRQARLYVMTRRPYDPIVPRTRRASLPARSTRDPRQAKLLLHARRIAGGW